MQDISYDEAERLLREHGGYNWLLDGPAFWSVREIADALKAEGANMGDDAIWRRVKKLPHTQNFGGPVGLKASRRDLVVMFATLMTGSSERTSDSRTGAG